MSAEAKEIFMDAIELEGRERHTFVEKACAHDQDLAQRVAGLLRSHGDASSVLGQEPPSIPAVLDELRAGQTIHGFRLMQEIGSGGFGTVWAAEQLQPFQRRVALKVLKVGMDTREVVARFEVERQALALMEHPGIAKVFDAGTTPMGRPYFAMEFVNGPPITDYCEAHELGVRDRVRLVMRVCAALKHAHQKGVIHRDIKPNNVLVAELDGELQPKVIDFGIAKAIGGALSRDTIMTREDQVIGTPGYMSPEQVEEGTDVDTRSDVYSVGALLYELLTGRPPIEVSTKNLLDIQRRITSEEPQRPSHWLRPSTNDGAARRPSLALRDVRGDLDWITMRCLEKDRDRRYDSIGLVAADLQRYLDGDVVSAGPPTMRYRTRKFVRRYWRGLVVGAAMAGVLVAGVVVSTHEASKARTAESDARRETTRSTAVANFLRDLLTSIDPATAKGRDTAIIEEVLALATLQVEEASEGLPRVEAELRMILGQARYAIGQLSEARLQHEKVLSIQESLVGPEHLDTYRAAAQLAPMLSEDGDLPGALELSRRAFRGLDQELGSAHRETRQARANLAVLLKSQGNYEEAEPLMVQIEEAAVAEHGAKHPDSLMASNNLGTLYSKLGRIEDARARFEFVHAVQAESLGDEDPRTMATLNNLAGAQENLGNAEEAERLYRELLETKQRIYAPGHPSKLIGMNNLAHFLARHDQPDEANRLRRKAIESSMEHHGLASRFTLTLLIGEGLAALKSGDYVLAEDSFRSILSETEGVFGPGGALELTAAINLAEVLFLTERAAEAVRLVEPVLDQLQGVFPEAHPIHVVTPAAHGVYLHADGRGEEALPSLLQGQLDLPGLGFDEWEARVAAALADLGQ